MEDENSLLSHIGLSVKEAQIYELLLNIGKVPAGELMQKSGLKRPTVYKILDTLKQKGLVEKDETQAVVRFRLKHPYALKEYLEERVQDIKTAEEKLDATLPHFIQRYAKSQGRPGVKFYEGIEGIKRIHKEILSEKKEIFAFVRIRQEWDDAVGEDFWRWYFNERKKYHINVRAIAPDNEEGRLYRQRDADELRETRLVSASHFTIEIEKNICGNKTAFLSLKPDEQIAVVIESSAIAATERAVFEITWKQAAEKIL